MTDSTARAEKQATTNTYQWYSPRCWHGMCAGDWLRMLRRNRWAVSPTRWGLAGTISVAAAFNSALAATQRLGWERKIRATRLVADPIFIMGHWRAGTTLLHEILVQDERFSYPDTYACFAPNHFILSRPLMVPWLRFLLPKLRPMDNMRLGWDRPQEDEFALANMGLPSPYESLAFPNRISPGTAHLDTRQWSDAERAWWKDRFLWFLKCVTYRDPRQIVLKSPPHTARLKLLAELFPRAKFVHIARNPYALFASTVRLWKSLAYVQGLQVPRNEDLEEHVLGALEEMYARLAEQQQHVCPKHFAEVRYEDLVADPEPAMRLVYQQLELGEFEAFLPKLDKYRSDTANYAAQRYDLPDATCKMIRHRWADYFQRYGYPDLSTSDR
ncbi:MAG: sulfotransferase [Pirellulales bacterium]